MKYSTFSKVDVLRRHLHELVSIYGEQNLVNLVNQKGHEQPVKDAYEHVVDQVCCSQSCLLYRSCILQAEVADVKYEYFDFHNECKNMRWDRINILIEKMQDDLRRQGYDIIIDTDPTVELLLAISTWTFPSLTP